MIDLMITPKCELCDREKQLQFHHLIPKQLHSKKKFIKLYSKKSMKTSGIHICKDCHKQIHKMFSHKYLAQELNTLQQLKINIKMQFFLKWIKKQK